MKDPRAYPLKRLFGMLKYCVSCLFFFFLIVLAKILIFAEGVLLRVIKSQRVESAKGEPRP